MALVGYRLDYLHSPTYMYLLIQICCGCNTSTTRCFFQMPKFLNLQLVLKLDGGGLPVPRGVSRRTRRVSSAKTVSRILSVNAICWHEELPLDGWQVPHIQLEHCTNTMDKRLIAFGLNGRLSRRSSRLGSVPKAESLGLLQYNLLDALPSWCPIINAKELK